MRGKRRQQTRLVNEKDERLEAIGKSTLLEGKFMNNTLGMRNAFVPV